MKSLSIFHSCSNCQIEIDDRVSQYSLDHFKYKLCRRCQEELGDRIQKTTSKTANLYFLLRKMGVDAQLEKNDGFKTIDIAVVNARLNIEVDGSHHNYKHEQALTDLKRTLYSFEKGYFTLRIPNSLVEHHPVEAAQYIVDIVNAGLKRRRSA